MSFSISLNENQWKGQCSQFPIEFFILCSTYIYHQFPIHESIFACSLIIHFFRSKNKNNKFTTGTVKKRFYWWCCNNSTFRYRRKLLLNNWKCTKNSQIDHHRQLKINSKRNFPPANINHKFLRTNGSYFDMESFLFFVFCSSVITIPCCYTLVYYLSCKQFIVVLCGVRHFVVSNLRWG